MRAAWIPALFFLALPLSAACDFATGARCRSDMNCPAAAPVCGDFDADGIGTCSQGLLDDDAGHLSDAGHRSDAGDGDDAGDLDAGPIDAGADAGLEDAGAGDDGGETGDGGDGDGGIDPCTAPPADGGPFLFGRLEFPVHDVTTDQDTLLLRIAASYPLSACSVAANETTATYDEATRNYLVRMPLEPGYNPIDLWVTGFGEIVTTSTGVTVRRVPYLPLDPRGVAVALPGGAPLVVAVDHAADVIMGLNPTSGVISKVSSVDVGEGPPLSAMVAMAAPLDDSAFVYALNDAQLFRIDVGTGERELIASEPTGVGTGPWGLMTALAVEATGQVAYAYDPAGTLVRIDIATKERTVLASSVTGSEIGTGASLADASGIAAVGSVVYVLAPGAEAGQLLRVDPGTGNRTIVSGPFSSGPALPALGPIAAVDGAVLVATATDEVYRIDGGDGTRSVVVSPSSDPELALRHPYGIAATDTHIWITDARHDGFLEIERASGAREARRVAVGDGPRLDEPRDITLAPSNLGFVVVDRQPRLMRVSLEGAREVISADDQHTDGLSYGDLKGVARTPEATVLITDDTNKAVWEYVFANDSRRVYSAGANSALSAQANVGTGPDMTALDDIAVESDGTAWVADPAGFQLYRIAVGAHERTINNFDGAGVAPAGLVVDPISDTLFVGDSVGDRVLRLNPDTGASATLTGDGVGLGTPETLGEPMDLAVSNGDTVWVVTRPIDEIVEVKHPGGLRRSVTYSSYDSRGPSLAGGFGIVADGHWGFVTSWGRNAIMIVDLVTGERAVFSQ